MAHVLVTGGAGFIGSFVVDLLVEKGHDVRILDNFEPQVHKAAPDYLNKEAELIKGDVLDRSSLKSAMQDVDILLHQAAMVGVGQSMYQISRYVGVNTMGTANMLDVLANEEHDIKKVVVASSMSTYGEGAYVCKACGPVSPSLRPVEQMKGGDWEVHCPLCGMVLTPEPTPETKNQEINSVYALTKMDQELMCLNVGSAYGIPTTALRYFNVYGPRQSLNNPYTGVAAIFQSRIKNDNPPLVFEDGDQSRDFVSVHDIAQANILAMGSKAANDEVFNVGSGNRVSILQVAETIAKLYGKDGDIRPKITGNFRKGDVRHCFADISKIKDKLGFDPKVSFSDGMAELIAWSKGQEAEDLVDKATSELQEKGLLE
ncbi:MAG: SDR family NAD(P)-dependent oxidoreductase [archaeon]